MADKASMAAVLQFARDIDAKHDQGHGRLRHDLDKTESDLAELSRRLTALEHTVMQQKAVVESPIDVSKIVFNPRMVIAIVGLVASIVTGNWLVTMPVREGLVRLQEQFTDNVRLQDERAKAVTDKVDTLTRQMEMRRLEIQQVSNDLQQLRRDK